MKKVARSSMKTRAGTQSTAGSTSRRLSCLCDRRVCANSCCLCNRKGQMMGLLAKKLPRAFEFLRHLHVRRCMRFYEGGSKNPRPSRRAPDPVAISAVAHPFYGCRNPTGSTGIKRDQNAGREVRAGQLDCGALATPLATAGYVRSAISAYPLSFGWKPSE